MHFDDVEADSHRTPRSGRERGDRRVDLVLRERVRDMPTPAEGNGARGHGRPRIFIGGERRPSLPGPAAGRLAARMRQLYAESRRTGEAPGRREYARERGFIVVR